MIKGNSFWAYDLPKMIKQVFKVLGATPILQTFSKKE